VKRTRRLTYIECPALNDKKIEHDISSAIKCMKKLIHSHTLDPTKFLMYSIWAPLVARHTTRRYSVYRQVLTSISLVTHCAALTVLSHNSVTFYTFSRQTVYSQTSRRFKSGERRGLSSNDQETPCPERHKREGGGAHHMTGKLFP
jgi:phosphoheptose isomerase